MKINVLLFIIGVVILLWLLITCKCSTRLEVYPLPYYTLNSTQIPGINSKPPNRIYYTNIDKECSEIEKDKIIGWKITNLDPDNSYLIFYGGPKKNSKDCKNSKTAPYGGNIISTPLSTINWYNMNSKGDKVSQQPSQSNETYFVYPNDSVLLIYLNEFAGSTYATIELKNFNLDPKNDYLHLTFLPNGNYKVERVPRTQN